MECGSPLPLFPRAPENLHLPNKSSSTGWWILFFGGWLRQHIFISSPKRQRAGAVQDAPRRPWAAGERGSVLECGSPLPLFPRAPENLHLQKKLPQPDGEFFSLVKGCANTFSRPPQSARGLAHSKTLRAVRGPSVNAVASWSAVALHRFSPAIISQLLLVAP